MQRQRDLRKQARLDALLASPHLKQVLKRCMSIDNSGDTAARILSLLVYYPDNLPERDELSLGLYYGWTLDMYKERPRLEKLQKIVAQTSTFYGIAPEKEAAGDESRQSSSSADEFLGQRYQFNLLAYLPNLTKGAERSELHRDIGDTAEPNVQPTLTRQASSRWEDTARQPDCAICLHELTDTLNPKDMLTSKNSSVTLDVLKRFSDASDIEFCPDILDGKRPVAFLPCGHQFHEKCVIDFKPKKPGERRSPRRIDYSKCPVCRGDIEQKVMRCYGTHDDRPSVNMMFEGIWKGLDDVVICTSELIRIAADNDFANSEFVSFIVNTLSRNLHQFIETAHATVRGKALYKLRRDGNEKKVLETLFGATLPGGDLKALVKYCKKRGIGTRYLEQRAVESQKELIRFLGRRGVTINEYVLASKNHWPNLLKYESEWLHHVTNCQALWAHGATNDSSGLRVPNFIILSELRVQDRFLEFAPTARGRFEYKFEDVSVDRFIRSGKNVDSMLVMSSLSAESIARGVQSIRPSHNQLALWQVLNSCNGGPIQRISMQGFGWPNSPLPPLEPRIFLE